MADSIQSVFLQELKENLPPHISLVDDLAELLSISRDSVYRRIRGETLLSLEEVKKICAHYNVSLDALFAPTEEMISFHHRRIDNEHFNFQKWLHSILGNLDMICGFPEKELLFAAKDVPIFHYFNYPELSAFKMYFWMKNYHESAELADKSFSADLIPRELIAVGKRIWERYQEIPSVEIWSDETAVLTLRQIDYSFNSGVLTAQQAHKIIDDYMSMIDSIFLSSKTGKKNPASFALYKNEILIAETTIFFKMGDKRAAFLVYNTTATLSTSQEAFCNNIDRFFTNLISKSTQISLTGEKERNRFFNQIRESAEAARKKIF